MAILAWALAFMANIGFESEANACWHYGFDEERRKEKNGVHTGLMACRIQYNCFQRMHGHCWFCLAATRPGWPLN